MRGSGAFEPGAVTGARAALAAEMRRPGVTQTLRELQAPEWETNYRDYLRRMGQLPVRPLRSAFSYLTWRPVLQSAAAMALDLKLVPERDLREVKQMAPERGRSR